MKKSILYILLIAFAPTLLLSQSNIIVNIHHKLGDEVFELDKPAKNNLDQDFKVKRMQYYLCDFTIIHDGGIETPMKSSWILADGSESTTSNLGAYDINTVEKIKFSIGVEEEYNHNDPASYDLNHPLAPKVPSMHWGWAAGYRFVAFEGFGGEFLNRLFELHGLGDKNLFTVEIDAIGLQSGDNIIINIDADYTRALENIDVQAGVIVHGEDFEAQQCLENMRDFVFSASDITSNIEDIQSNEFFIYPNPSYQGLVTIDLSALTTSEIDVEIASMEGKIMQKITNVNSQRLIDVSNLPKGIYIVNITTDQSFLGAKKLFIR